MSILSNSSLGGEQVKLINSNESTNKRKNETNISDGFRLRINGIK